jgi:NAD(P)H dehydrogenase (quinone)
MYAVTGATGQLGRLVISTLTKLVPPSEIVAIARDKAKAANLLPQGITVREADYDQPATLRSALVGVERLLLISSNAVGRRVKQHEAVIRAANDAGVSVLLYTSVLHANRSPLGLAVEHQQTEEALNASDMRTVILRNGWYTENYLSGVIPALKRGSLIGSAGDGRIASAARADYAAAAATVLAGTQSDGVYELAGDDSWTLTDLAAIMTQCSGKSVAYTDVPKEAYREALIGAGISPHVADIIADADAAAAQGGLFDDSRTLSSLIGRPTIPLAEMVNAAIKA